MQRREPSVRRRFRIGAPSPQRRDAVRCVLAPTHAGPPVRADRYLPPAGRITVLDALGRSDEAQALCWSEFGRALRAEPLRAYLKRLSDFADVEKEEEALDHVFAHPDVHAALGFMTTWPDLCRARALVRARLDAIHGNCYWTLTPAAEGLENKEPLAFLLIVA